MSHLHSAGHRREVPYHCHSESAHTLPPPPPKKDAKTEMEERAHFPEPQGSRGTGERKLQEPKGAHKAAPVPKPADMPRRSGPSLSQEHIRFPGGGVAPPCWAAL